MTKRKKRKARAYTELPDEPTLEDILRFLHGRDEKMLLDKTTLDDDGHIDKYATALGQKTYRKLVALLYGIGTLIEYDDEAEDIVMALDQEVRYHGR
jgi:hypothetical protein